MYVKKKLKIKMGYIVTIFKINTMSFLFLPRNAKRLAIYHIHFSHSAPSTYPEV